MSQEHQHPTCYYHPELPITHMCLSQQCTMPLCEKCLTEHKNQSPSCVARTVPFEKACEFASQAAEEQIRVVTQRLRLIDSKFQEFRNAFNRAIESCLVEVFDSLKAKINKSDANIDKLNQRKTKIENKDLKQIISQYMSIFNNPISEIDFIYNIRTDTLRQQIQKTIQIKIPEEVPALPLKKHKEQKEINKYESNEQSQSNNLKEKKLINWLVQENRQLFGDQDKQKPQHKETYESVTKRKNRPGIFVASSPNRKQSEWLNMSRKKIIENRNQNNASNIQNQQKRGGSKALTLDSNLHNSRTENYKIQNQLRPSSAKYTTNPQFFQLPQKVYIYKQSSQMPQTPTGSQRCQTPKQSSAKNVINKQDLASNSSSSRLILRNRTMNSTEHHQRHSSIKNQHSKNNLLIPANLGMRNNQVLNPQQMRQLILRKKNIIDASQASISQHIGSNSSIMQPIASHTSLSLPNEGHLRQVFM